MKLNEKKTNVKSKISTLLYVIAAIVAVLGIGMLSVNIYVFKSTIDQYVAQGYPADLVMKSMVPSQLLPGIFEPLALYGGLVFVLIGVGVANSKIAAHFASATATEENKNENQEATIESEEYNNEYTDPVEAGEEEQEQNQEVLDSEIAVAEEENKNA